jgi:hypothetical protein
MEKRGFMRRHLFATLAASAALAVFVAACGGSATAAPSAAAPSVAASVAPSVEPSPSPEASAAAAASTEPVASGALPSFVIPSFTADKDLEALLPSTFDGAPLQKISFKGAQFLGQDPTSDSNKIVTALGLNASDVSAAAAADAAGKLDVTFAAIRFAGADSGKLLEVFKAASQASGELIGSVNLGGKDVIKTKDSSGTFSYFYVRNDVVFGVTTKDDATAAKALAVLP